MKLGRFAASPFTSFAACRRPCFVDPGALDTVKSKICRSPACSRHLVMLLLGNSTDLLNRIGGMFRSACTARPRRGRVVTLWLSWSTPPKWPNTCLKPNKMAYTGDFLKTSSHFQDPPKRAPQRGPKKRPQEEAQHSPNSSSQSQGKPCNFDKMSSVGN